MSLALPEFARQLQPLLPGWQVRQPAPGQWQLQSDGQRVDIACRPLPPLRAGVLELPRLEVTLLFAPAGSDRETAFIADFQRHFRRGGG